MVGSQAVVSLVEAVGSYEDAARTLGIPAGLAYLVATGCPADGAHQHLVNPPAENPTRKEHVLTWIRDRVASDVQMQAAAAAASRLR